MAVFRNLKEIPVPDFATADKKSGEVSVYTVEPVTNRRKRYIIGRLLSNGNMNVTSGFKEHHRDLWEQYFGEAAYPTNGPLSCGLYAVLLWLASKTGLYACVQEAFGNEKGNDLLDFASFGIEHKTNAAYSLTDSQSDSLHNYLASHATLSTDLKSEASYSRLLSSITQDEIASFKERWVQALTQAFEVKKVWLTLDKTMVATTDATSTDAVTTNAANTVCNDALQFGCGDSLKSAGHAVTESDGNACSSNSGCNDKDVASASMAKHTMARTSNSCAVVGRITAIAADINMPVTWYTYKGNTPTASDIKHVADFLAAFGIEVEGIILDRRFNQQAVVDTVESLGYDWVMQLRSDSEAHRQMFEQYAQTIRWNSAYLIDEDDLFAISGQAPLFKDSKSSSYISLFFNALGGAESQVQLIKEAYDCVSSINRKIESGLTDIEIPLKHRQWVYLDTNEDGSPVAKLNHQALNEASQKKGFYSIASSLDLPCLSAKNIYSMRAAVANADADTDVDVDAYGYDSDTEFSDTAGFSADDGHSIAERDLVGAELSVAAGLSADAKGSVDDEAFVALPHKGINAIRAHSDDSDMATQSALSCLFISSILRTMLSMIAKAEGTATHRLIQGLADVRVLSTNSKNTYSIDSIAKKKYLSVIRNLGITEQCLKDIAAETHIARDGAPLSPIRVIPNLIEVKDKYGFNKQHGIELSELDNVVSSDMNGLKKRKPGRPKGSKNKSTLEREARIALQSRETSAARASSAARAASTACESLQPHLSPMPQAHTHQAMSGQAMTEHAAFEYHEAHTSHDAYTSSEALTTLKEQAPKPRSKGGRPKGSKNKKTLEREAQLRRDLEKRGPGRPKGSKNKSTLEKEALAAQAQVKRGRGRPKGSKNKSTLEREAAALLVPKRGPGRPRGSRTKPAPPPDTSLLR